MGATVSVRTRREENVLHALRKKEKLRTKEAADILNASECTARRLFRSLEQQGEAVRIYGGIKLPSGKRADYHFENLQFQQSVQKQRLGEYASRIVVSGDIVFLDSGTTIQQMALCLAERFKRRELHDVQVFTNSLRNLTILSDLCDVHLIGGLFRVRRQDFCGYLSEMVLESVSFEKCFLSADGISLNPADGIMATDIFTAKINQIVVRRAVSTYLLADSSKFTRRSFIQYATIEQIHTIITDQGLSKEVAEAVASLGTKIELV